MTTLVDTSDSKKNTILHQLLASHVLLIQSHSSANVDQASLWARQCSCENNRNSDEAFPIEHILHTEVVTFSHAHFVSIYFSDVHFINEKNRDGESILQLSATTFCEGEFSFIHSVLDCGGDIFKDRFIKAAISSRVYNLGKVVIIISGPSVAGNCSIEEKILRGTEDS